MKRDLVKLMGSILLVGVIIMVALPACSSSAAETMPVPATPQTTDTTTVAPAPTTSAPGLSDSDLLAQGKLIFEKTAGGVGCAFCHELDAKGGGGGPNIRGAGEFMVRDALNTVPAMSFIKLNDEERTALVAYLQYLTKQP